MMRSMFSAVSGLRAHQTRMDVIGNNIANVNTVGFKGSRVTFQEVFSQTLKGAGSPQDGRGGTNPQQIGLGINVSSMDTFHIRGSVERTDYNTDLMINGEGFFIVSDDANGINQSYTRAGNFAIDEAGNLVTAEGYRVLGYMADENGVLQSNLGGLVISKAMTFDPQVTTEVTFEGNLDSETEVFSGTPMVATNPSDNSNAVYQAVLKDPAAPPSASNPIIGYKINPNFEDTVARETTYQVYDSFGGAHQIKQAYIKTGTTTYDVVTFYVHENGDMVLAGTGTGDGDVTVPSTTELEFGPNGRLIDGGTESMTIRVGSDFTNGAGEISLTVDFNKLTMAANKSTASAQDIDGYKQGTLEDFAVAPTGEIVGVFDNNQRRVIGQVALANFKNPAGLEKTGSNMYRTTANSGQPIVGVPGAGGFGSLNPGALEMSNVDLSREFTNMITTQRGFQANSRIITTSDEMLQEVVNMKR